MDGALRLPYKVNMHIFSILSGFSLAFLLLPLAQAAGAPDCVSCHPAYAARKKSHGPAAVGTCAVCHVGEKKGGKHHTFTLSKEQPELCLSCHEDFRAKLAAVKVPHAAIDSGGCTSCHDPHGSTERFFIKDPQLDKVCSACHDAKTKGAVVHSPVKNSCVLCHDPHGGQAPKLLTTAAPKLCLDCHKDVEADLARKHAHAPAKGNCALCHDAHSSAKPKLLRHDGGRALCVTCHKKIDELAKAAKRPHKALDKGCPACHAPHGSSQPALLNASMADLCTGCHKAQKAEVKSPFLHGPVRLAQCQGCHEPHGGPNPLILKTYFPEPFYNQYKDGLYALCFNCHEKDIAKQAKTTTLTGFRNGDQNLHFVHVNSKKGRSCKACHAVHGGKQQKHVREEVPFGSWMLPIKYVKTPNGGNCTVGCHTKFGYDRVIAVLNK